MDTLAGIAFAYEPPLKEYMYEKPKNKNEQIILKAVIIVSPFNSEYNVYESVIQSPLPCRKNQA